MALKIDYKDKKEQRKFGLLVGVVFIIIGTIRWAIHSFVGIPYIWWGIGGVLIILGAIFPKILQPLFFLWIKLAEALNWLMTRLFLIIAFYLVITPTGILYRLLKGDPLNRQWLSKDKTYWDEVEAQPENIEEFRRQF